jgi:glycosyltransferase involved in cell wall biosynthesis
VLVLASYFPKPTQPLMGIWSLSEARALRRQGIDAEVVAFTSWVPRLLTRVPDRGGALARAKPWALCPPEHDWDDLHASYPRWPVYRRGPHLRFDDRDPMLQLRPAWAFARRRLERLVAGQRPHVVYAQASAANGFLALQLKRSHGLPYVVAEHDFGEIRDCYRYPRRRHLYERVMGAASAVTTVNQAMAHDVRELFPDVNVVTVPNGADPIPPELFDRPRPPELEGRLVVTSAGGFYPRKGFPTLVCAFAEAASSYPEAVLRIAGDGEDRPAVEAAIADTGFGERVQLLGMQPHERVLQEIVWSDVFALVGWEEPFATAYVEAMAAGRPIVFTEDGGIGDLARDGVHGLAVPPRDAAAAARAIEALLSDPERRRAMGAAGAALFAERLTRDRQATAAAELLREAATQCRPTVPAPSGGERST